MNRTEIRVTCYVCRRRRRKRVPSDEYVYDVPSDRDEYVYDEYVYEVWTIIEYRPLDADAPERSEDSVHTELGNRLRDAVDETIANRVAGRVWRIDDLSEQQAADFVINLPAKMKSLAGMPIEAAAGIFGVPAPAASFGTDVIATMLLKPVLGPLNEGVRVLEVMGIVVGLLTGLHSLVITCMSRLVHAQLGSALACALESVQGRTEVVASPTVIATVSGLGPSSAPSGVVSSGNAEVASPETQKLFQDFDEIVSRQNFSAPLQQSNETPSPASGAAEAADQADTSRWVAGPDDGISLL